MHATVRTTHSPRTLRLRHSPLALALAACLSAAPVAGLAQVSANQLPTGGSIAGGTGTINAPSGANLSIDQTSTRMALNWSTFDIGSAATVTFNQPSSSAAVLNLIQGGNPTQIFGNLNANGQVFLINTNGMIFGSTAQINVGGLVASTLGTTASNFMSGNDILDAGGNTVALMSNGGTINAAAGAVDLIGGKVVNSGTITASAGNINLVGADQVTLTFESGGFGVVVNKALQLQLDTLAVDNSGSLIAPGGIITLQARAARGVFDQLINNSGIIRAAAISGSDGSVSLVANGAGGVGIAGSGSINVGTGTLLLSSSSSAQQSGVLTTGDLQATTTGNLALTGSNQIAQVSGTVGGALSLTNARDLSQNSSLEVDGTSTFALGTNTLTLNQANDFKNTVGISAGATSISDVNALTLGTLSTGALTVSNSGALNLGSGSAASITASSGNGAISQTGALTVAGSSVVNAGTGAITLSNADNDFQGAVGLTGGVTQVRDKNALQLGSLSTGALTVRSSGGLNLGSGSAASLDANSGNGAISQNGALSVTGTSSINAGSAGIALTNAANNFGAGVSLTGTGIALTDSNDLIVSSVTGGSNGAIALTAGGALTLPAQNLDTGTADLSLRANGGALTTAGTLSGRNISLTGNQGITLAHNVGSTGTLALTSGNSAIVQTAGTLTAGTTTTVNAGSGAITLDNLGNDFRSGVSLTGTGITLRDSNDLSIAALTGGSNGSIVLSAGGALSLPAQNLDTGTANLSLRANGGALSTAGTLRGNAIALSARDGLTLGHDITATGGLGLSTAGSAINQTGGTLGVAGLSSIDAGGGNITLSSAGNDFQGAVTLAGNAVQIRDANTLTLASVSTGALGAISNGALTLGGGSASSITAASNGGAIAQTGALTVGNAGASTFNAGTGSITLDNVGNDFQGALSLTGTGIGVRDSNDLVVSALNGGANGAIALTAAGTLSLPAQNIDTGTGALSLIANGGVLSTAGALSGGNVSLRARDGLNLNHGISASGTLGLTASIGAITQGAGVLDVGGLTTVDAGTSAITLERDNDFRNGIALTGRNIAVVDANDLSVNALTNSGIGNISLTARGSLSLPATGLNAGSGTLALRADTGTLTLGGDLTGNAISLSSGNALTLGSNITSGGGALSVSTNNRAINQTAGALNVGGTSSFNAGTGSISLGSADNHFTGAVTLSGRATLVRDSGALTLGTLSTGALTVIGNGSLNLGSGSADSIVAVSNGNAIAQSGALTVRQASTLVAGGGSITLDQAGNDFQGGLSLTGAGITLRDANDLTISSVTSNNNGNIALTAGGTLTLPAQDLNNGSGDITLIANGGLSTAGALRGDEVTLRANGGLALGHDIAARTLSLTSTDTAIAQSAGTLAITGATTVDAGAGSIALLNTGNDFNTLSLVGNGIGVYDSNNLSITSLSSGGTGTIALTANGTLTLPTQTIAAGSGNLSLTANGGALNSAGTLSGNAVSLTARDGLSLGHAITASTLALSSTNAAINQTAGALTVSGATTVDAGTGSIALNGTGNRFGTGISLTGTGIAVTDSGTLTINALNAGTNGSIALTAGGALNLSAQDIDTGSGNLSLIANGGSLGTGGTLSGRNVTLRASNGVALGHNISATDALSLSSNNTAIEQTAGRLNVGALTTVDAGTGNITLGNTANTFAGAVNLTGGNVQIAANALTLGALSTNALTATSNSDLNLGGGNVRGVLNATSNNAAITQAGALSVDGVFALNAGTGAITLTSANNDFVDVVSVTGGNVAIADRTSLTLGSVSAGALTVSSVGDLNLGTGSIGTTLSATTSNNAITQTGPLTVGGASGLNAGTGAITLRNAANVFQGALSLTGGITQIDSGAALALGTLSTGALTISNNGALTLGSGRVASLAASSSGNAIAQSGALEVGGPTNLNAGTANITLLNTANDFGDTVTLTAGDARVTDRNALTLGTLATGNLAVTSVGALNLGSGTIGGTLTATSNNGAISQSGALTVAGTGVLNAGSGSITLIDSNNALQGRVDLVGATTQLRNNTALTLGSIDTGALDVSSNGALNLGSGRAASLIASSNGNAITQAGALAVVGNSRLDAGANSITLTNAGNDFAGAVSLIGGAAQLADSNALTLNTLDTGALTLASGGPLTLGTGTVDGALNASANGAIGQTGALTVTGSSRFAAGNNAITLNNAGNDFRDTVSLTGGVTEIVDRNELALGTVATAALTATSTGALNLGSGTINGALSVQSNNGALTQGGVLSVAGTSTLNAGSGTIALNNAGNAFAGAVNLIGGDVQIAASALTLGALSTSTLTATSAGALNLGSGNVRGTLTGTSGNAAITQTGALSVDGASSLNAGSGNIALNDANNDFVGALALTGNAIAVQDRNDLSIAALQSGANAALSLVAGGGLNLPVSQIDTGNGALTLTANGGSLRTNGTLRGGDVQLTGANGIELTNAIGATSTLTLNSTNAAITQSGGALLVAGNTAVNAGNGAITLDAAGNDFQGVLSLSGGASSVRDANALTLGALNTGSLQVTNNGALNLGVGSVNGDLLAASNGGAVAQSGALTVTGSTRIDSGGAQIALTDAGNDFQAAVSLAGGNSSVRDRNALALGEIDVGALDVASGAGLDLGQGRIGGALLARSGTAATAAGTTAITAQALAVPLATTAGITQQGALTVVGSSVLDAGTGTIVLTDAGNDFQGSVQARGGSIAIVDRNDLAIAAQATDTLRLQAGGQLASSGALSAADIALSGGTGVLLGHDVGGGNVSLSSGGAITQTAGSLRAARLSGNATGSATLTGSNNAIAVLGDFSAQGLDLVSNRTLLVSGRVEGGSSLRLRSGGELQLDGQLSGAASWLQAVAGIRQRAGSWIAADLLSGSAGGAVVLGDATSFIDNRIGRLGNFTASSGFSLTNGGDLLLVLANGSRYSVDAGNSALYLSVRGDLLQDGRALLRNGTGTFAATGRIGTQQNPIYVVGTGTQTVAAVGAPPAYFNATTADGGLLDLGGGSGFNVPTSAFASRAQSSASRTVAFVDLSASGTPYRAFGLVRPGLRLPDDQQPACDAGDPDAVCSPE